MYLACHARPGSQVSLALASYPFISPLLSLCSTQEFDPSSCFLQSFQTSQLSAPSHDVEDLRAPSMLGTGHRGSQIWPICHIFSGNNVKRLG